MIEIGTGVVGWVKVEFWWDYLDIMSGQQTQRLFVVVVVFMLF